MRPLGLTVLSATLATLGAAATVLPPVSAVTNSPLQVPAPTIKEPVGSYTGFTYVPRVQRPSTGAQRTPPVFIVTYDGFPVDAQTAFQYALDIWGTIIQSPLPIRVTAYWRDDLPAYVVAAAGGGAMVRDFINAPRANTYYPAAVANARAGRDLTPGDEIIATFNGAFDWYLGIDGQAGTQMDFVSVALHEIGHGLGFSGSLRVEGSVGSWGIGSGTVPVAYDLFMATSGSRYLTNTNLFPNRSATLGQLLMGGEVRFLGPTTLATLPVPKIYAPSPWMGGSSLSHLDDQTYPNGDPNSLMTPSMSPGEVIHDPGPMAARILADLGWRLQPGVLPPPPPPGAPVNMRMVRRR